MRRVFALLWRDYQHVAGNVIALLVCVGLAVMPSLYAWFNIAGGWDPYGNTAQMKIAVANSDEGISGDIIPYHVNVGERVLAQLVQNDKVGFTVTSEEEAIEGVSSGEYYAAVVFPKNFSNRLLSVLTSSPAHPQLDYYVNQKRNAIASIVTGKVSGSVQSAIDEGLTKSVSQVTTELMDELSGLLDDESILTLASTFENAVDDSISALRRSADDINAYKGVVASIRSVASASSSVLGASSPSLDAAHLLSEAANGVREFDAAANTAKDAASSAIDGANDALVDVETSIDDAVNVADGKTDELIDAFNKVIDAASTRRDQLQDLRNRLDGLNGQVYSFSEDVERTVGEAQINIDYAHTVSNDISDLLSRLDNTIGYLNDIISTSERTLSDVQTAKSDVGTNREKLKMLAQQAYDGIEGARQSYNDRLSGSLDGLANSIDEAAADAANVSANLEEQINNLSPVMNDASRGLGNVERSLDKAANKIDGVADKLDDLHKKLLNAMASNDLNMIRTIFSADPDALVDFFTAPVELEREAVYSIENNGSAMAPYYTTMALWVGGTLMGVLFYAAVSEAAIEETGSSRRHAYFGRLLFFLTLGFVQSTMLLLGDIFFLGIQCEHPVLFLLTGWLASTVFINIIYSLSSSFGDVGKAIGVLFMVIQVAGSGGTFPVQMLPPLFQTLYRFLPFVYSEDAMRETICGVYGNHWLMDMGMLALYLVPALLLGLLISKPFVPVNEWIEEHLEETKFM